MERMLEVTAGAENRHYWFRALRRQARLVLDAAVGDRPIGRVVDCGTGTGRNLDWLARYGPAVGVELSPTGLAVARRHGRRVVRGSVTALPLASTSVALATSFDVLYCLDDASEAAALAEMHRVLIPGGTAFFNVAALDSLHGSHSTLTGEVRRYTPDRLRRRLTTAGFDIGRLTFTNMSLVAPAWLVRSAERVTGRSSEASEANLRVPASPINTLLDAVLHAEAGLLRVANLPIGTSLMAVARKPGGAAIRPAAT